MKKILVLSLFFLFFLGFSNIAFALPAPDCNFLEVINENVVESNGVRLEIIEQTCGSFILSNEGPETAHSVSIIVEYPLGDRSNELEIHQENNIIESKGIKSFYIPTSYFDTGTPSVLRITTEEGAITELSIINSGESSRKFYIDPLYLYAILISLILGAISFFLLKKYFPKTNQKWFYLIVLAVIIISIILLFLFIVSLITL